MNNMYSYKYMVESKSPSNTIVPNVIEKVGKSERSWDIFSRLLKDRIIMVTGEVNEVMMSIVTAQLLFLESEDDESPVHMYINSPGGSIVDGLAIIDTMNLIKAPVYTYCLGMCASMGAMLLSQGEKGHRYILPNGEVMIHQPLGGFNGQATDFDIHSKRILKMKENLLIMLAEACNQPYEKVAKDCERDYFLEAEEALAYGIVDKIHSNK